MADGLGALAVRWTPCSSFPLRGLPTPSLASAGWPPLEEFNLRLSVRTGASCALDEAGKWSPREDFNLHYRVRSPVVCALAYEGMVVARGIEPRPRASEARVISVSLGDGGRGRMGPPGSVELPLAAYRAATLRSVGGVVTSRGIEPRSLGLQPSAMTTLARWSLDGADGGSRTRACALRGRRASGNTSSTWSRRLESNQLGAA